MYGFRFLFAFSMIIFYSILICHHLSLSECAFRPSTTTFAAKVKTRIYIAQMKKLNLSAYKNMRVDPYVNLSLNLDCLLHNIWEKSCNERSESASRNHLSSSLGMNGALYQATGGCNIRDASSPFPDIRGRTHRIGSIVQLSWMDATSIWCLSFRIEHRTTHEWIIALVRNP